jgi:hypothetical protein
VRAVMSVTVSVSVERNNIKVSRELLCARNNINLTGSVTPPKIFWYVKPRARVTRSNFSTLSVGGFFLWRGCVLFLGRLS